MDFNLTEEQQLIVKTTRDFVRAELVPHEREVEDSGQLQPQRLQLTAVNLTAVVRYPRRE